MNILLTNPLTHTHELELPDLGLGYLASTLRADGHTVRLSLRNLTPEEFQKQLRENPPDIVGIKVFTSLVHDAARTVNLVREACGATVVLGGPHVTGDPENVLELVPADYAIAGEADNAFPAFLRDLREQAPPERLHAHPGLIWRENDRIHTNPPEVVADIDDLPEPAWDLMPPGTYQSFVRQRFPAASILATRGCTNACLFCAEARCRLRIRNVESIVNEIQHLHEEYGVREIQFIDSNFLARRDYILDLCEAIRARGLDLAFCAPNGARMEHVDEEIARALAGIGFYRVSVGVESGSQEVLDAVNKHSDLSAMYEKVNILQRHGIHVIANFMMGFPGETRKQMQQTLRMALSLNVTGANFSIYTPMPGTALYRRLQEEGKLPKNPSFKNHTLVNYDNDLTELSAAELKRFRNHCILRYLLRPHTLKSLWTLHRSGVLWNNLMERIYWMYLAKYLRERRAPRRNKDS